MRRTTGAIVCPSCERLVSASERKCPFCGAWQPGLYGFGPALQRMFGDRFDLSAQLTVVCVAMYVLSLALEPAAIFRMRSLFDLLGPGQRALFQLGMTGGVAWQMGMWWTTLTAVFLHGSIIHILFNMMVMRQFLPLVESIWGPARGFLIFMAGGVLGFVVSNLASNSPTIGASGAIFGLIGALIAYGRRTGQSGMTQQLWSSAIFMFIFGFLSPSVNNWAHAGGFAGGWAAAELLGWSYQRREGGKEIVFALAVAGLTTVGIGLSFWRVTSVLMAR